jgi:WhiB family redox-sensing transcriptional regulator
MIDFSFIDDTAENTWLDNAACLQSDLSDFFVESGKGISNKVVKLCLTCPVQDKCLEWAYKQNRQSGYMGGISGRMRRVISFEDAKKYIEKQKKALSEN